MADFEDNPFADPDGINPFADPAVTQAASTAPPAGVTDDYNPFAEDTGTKEPEPPRIPPPPTKSQVKSKEKQKDKSKGKQKPAAPQRPPETEPAIMQPDEPPPTYTPAPSTFADPQSDEIKKKEEEIARREQALQERERNLERLGPGEQPKNFPPFPKFCPYPLKPCFYINVKVEIPPAEQWKVYCLFGILIFTWVCLILNTLISIVGAITINIQVPPGTAPRGGQSEYLTTMGVSILYLVLFVPGSLFCWFLPLYQAYKKDSSLSFMWFFFVMLFQILGFILNGIGIPNLGACGFFNGSKFFNAPNIGGAQATGALFMIMGFLWFVAAPVTIGLLILVHRYYRTSGHTINQAVEEGVSGAAKNKHVRSAVKTTVSTGVKTAFAADNK